MEILRQINVKTTLVFITETNECYSVIEWWPIQLVQSDTRKGEKTQANRNLNWEKHHLPMSGILIVEPGRKKSLNWSKKNRFVSNARLAVRLLRLESVRVESDNFPTFSLVEKAHVKIKRKIRMCLTHGLPWELVETKWWTNTEDCSYRFAVLTSFIQEPSTIKTKDRS